MYAVVRTYSGQGASELLDLLGQREQDVKALISGVPGFVNYAAVRSGDGGVTVTVCEDKVGTDESSRRAAEWVAENVSATANPPGDHGGEHRPPVLGGDTVAARSLPPRAGGTACSATAAGRSCFSSEQQSRDVAELAVFLM